MGSETDPDLGRLLSEIADLNQRVTRLENQLQYISQASPSAPGTGTAAGMPEAPAAKPPRPPRVPIQQRLSEEFIGGKLLNRIGALIVVIAVAYFLKWSFDNDIIGELGRCLLGLAGGILFMAGGHFYYKKGYGVFSQGLTGAGIAIIYLSTYAAVNYYDLISPYMAFAAMFLTSIAGGVISAADDMAGTAVISALGGFMVPFLMGAHTGQILPLLTYVLILDLGILLLAFYRQWFYLDFLALMGSFILAVAAYNLNWKIWTGQVFLAAFLFLFSAVAILYNHRTRDSNPGLLLSSAVLFGAFTFFNLYDEMNQWLGLICLILAAIYALTYLLVTSRKWCTEFFTYTILIIALVYSALTGPAQLQGVYNQLAWLAIAAASLYYSWFSRKLLPYLIGLAVLIVTARSVHVELHPRPFLNDTSVVLFFTALDWAWALWVTGRNYARQKWLLLSMAVVATGIVFFLLDYDISNAIYYYQANQSFSFLIPISWAAISSLVLWLGVHRDKMEIRLFSLLLYGVVILRTIFYDLRQLDIVFKIMVLMVIGLIALAVSFFYQKRMKGGGQNA
ncbi:MAG: DUF2339 domain-containing protein [Syntrophomonadaceae bacterium]